MGILFDSDKVGIALGLVVFLIMVLMGLHGQVSPAVVIVRALFGFTIAYVLGFMLSRWITSALVTALATERAKRIVTRKPPQATREEETEEKKEETGES